MTGAGVEPLVTEGVGVGVGEEGEELAAIGGGLGGIVIFRLSNSLLQSTAAPVPLLPPASALLQNSSHASQPVICISVHVRV